MTRASCPPCPTLPQHKRALAAGALVLALALGGCASHPGRYYQDDGPPEHVPAGLDSVPDAVPRPEALNPAANRPYTALGHRYTPDTSDAPFEQRGIASWYGRQYHGSHTASGEPYDMFAMTAAHPTLPIPSYARVTSTRDGRSVIVRVNDRGPFLQDRVIDLSYAAAVRLGLAGSGSGEVTVRKITASDIAAGNFGAVAAAHPGSPPPVAAPEPVAAAAPAVVVSPVAPAGVALGATTLTLAAAPLAPAAAATVLPSPMAAAAPAAAPGTAPQPAVTPPPEPAAMAATDTPGAADQAPWSVQFGAFAQLPHAQALSDALTAQLAGPAGDTLPPAQRHPRVQSDAGLHRVLVGAFASRAAAQAAAATLKSLLSREAVLFKR